MECDLKREMKCEIECDSLPHNAPQTDDRKQQIKRVNGGIEGLSDLALFTELLPVLKTPRLGVFIEPEVGHGETEVHTRVQA